MSVHKAISQHSQKQHEAIRKFLKLDAEREAYIEEAISKCRNNEDFTVDKINQVTKEINELAKNEIVPTRVLVTKDMIVEYTHKLKQ